MLEKSCFYKNGCIFRGKSPLKEASVLSRLRVLSILGAHAANVVITCSSVLIALSIKCIDSHTTWALVIY